MLKLTYTENGFQLERLTESPEQLVALRVMLAMRVGESVSVSPSTASFLLPVSLSVLQLIEAEVRRLNTDLITLCVADAEFVEISLQGTWITTNAENAEGIFITVLSDRLELLLSKIWFEGEADASFSRVQS